MAHQSMGNHCTRRILYDSQRLPFGLEIEFGDILKTQQNRRMEVVSGVVPAHRHHITTPAIAIFFSLQWLDTRLMVYTLGILGAGWYVMHCIHRFG